MTDGWRCGGGGGGHFYSQINAIHCLCAAMFAIYCTRSIQGVGNEIQKRDHLTGISLTSSRAVTVFLQWDILVVKLEAVGDL